MAKSSKVKTESSEGRPPTRDGVSPSSLILPDGPWATVLEFLVQRFPAIAPDVWLRRMNAGEVLDAAGRAIDTQRAYEPNTRIFYYRALAAEPRIPFGETILFQDEYLVVADKPHFLPVIPSGRYLQETLLVRLKRKMGIDTLSPIHRIDRETAGLVVFTIQPNTRRAYQDLFLTGSIQKSYEAIAPSRPELKFPLIYRSRLVENPERFMQVREEEGESNSETHIELIETHGTIARYRVKLITGRKHQIRVHFSALGIPILHDQIYPQHLPENTDDFTKPLQLIARFISFRDPLTGVDRSFTSQRTLTALPS